LVGATQGGGNSVGQGTVSSRAAIGNVVEDAARSAATAATAAGVRTGGAANTAGESPPTLFQRTAEALSGGAVAGAAQSLVDDAVASIASESLGGGEVSARSARVERQQTARRPAQPGSTGRLGSLAGDGADIFGNMLSGVASAADAGTRRYRVNVTILPSQGLLPKGFRSMRLDDRDGNLLTEGAGNDSPDTLRVGFISPSLATKLTVILLADTPQGQLELRDSKAVLVPALGFDAITQLQFNVRPTLRVLTLRVKARVNLPVLLEPDTADLDTQLAARGIDRMTLAKPVDFKLAPELPPSFDATLLLYTGKLTIEQVS
jgi:hypothetical protein